MRTMNKNLVTGFLMFSALGSTLAWAEDKPAPAPPPIVVRAKRKLPERAALPPAGEHPAQDILSIAGVLSGRVVRLESERVRETSVIIDDNLAGDQVTYAELKLILAAHKLYLFPIVDAKEGEVLVVSRNPDWREEPPRFSRVIEIQGKAFLPAWERIQRAVEERNGKMGKSETPIVAVPDERTGKVLLGADKEVHLTELARELETEVGAPAPAGRRYHTYVGRYRSVKELEAALREKLAPADLNKLHIFAASRGNRLLASGPTESWEKAQELLKQLDVQKGR